MSIKEQCIKAGIKECTYYYRREKGMSHEEALSVPIQTKHQKKNIPCKEVSEKQSNEPGAIFALFKSETGHIKAIYNGEITKTQLLEVATHLRNEALKIMNLIK